MGASIEEKAKTVSNLSKKSLLVKIEEKYSIALETFDLMQSRCHKVLSNLVEKFQNY